MEINEYYNQKKEFYSNLIKYINDGNDSNEADYQNLITNIENQNISENQGELKEILRTIFFVSNNHRRYSGFVSKIEKVLIFLKDQIKQTFSNSELFDFFKENKLIILLLIENNILVFDKSIFDKIVANQNDDKLYYHFFYPEIDDKELKQKIENDIMNMDPNIFDNFDQKRKTGENDSFICSLIRNDSIDEFIEFIKKSNFSLSTKIVPSIFETNPFLINKQPTLIEYAAFFRSVRIIQYLIDNQIELTPSLWLYAIHGLSIELIHTLNENKVELEDKSYKIYLEESIKCHHNDIVNYFLDNFLSKDDENATEFGFRYRNYSYMPKNINDQRAFCYLCKYDYFSFVDFILKTEKSILNASIVLKNEVLNEVFLFD